MSTEEKFMQILCNYVNSSVEDKRFLIFNCDTVYHDRDDVSYEEFFILIFITFVEMPLKNFFERSTT